MIRTSPTTAKEADALLQELAVLDFSAYIKKVHFVSVTDVLIRKGVIRKVGTVTGLASKGSAQVIVVVFKTPPIASTALQHCVSCWVDLTFERWAAELGTYVQNGSVVEL